MPGPTSTSTPTVPWPDVLDLLEQRLTLVRQVVEGGDLDLPAALEVVPDGPLPQELQVRAHDLLARTRQAELEVRRLMAREARAAVVYSRD